MNRSLPRENLESSISGNDQNVQRLRCLKHRMLGNCREFGIARKKVQRLEGGR